jgi:hypothetical protein
VAPSTSLSTSALEVDRSFAGLELNGLEFDELSVLLSTGIDDEAMTSDAVAPNLVSEVGVGAWDVM